MFVCTVMFCSLGAHAKDIDISIETFNISGSIGVEGVELQGFPDDQYVETNSNGEYYAVVEYDWSGTITPKKEGYTFSPSSIPYKNVTQEMLNQDYKATPITFTISGKVGSMEGVVLNGLPGNPVTSANGSFSVVVDYGWSGQVEPYKEGFEFNPPSVDVESLKGSKTLNFTPSAVKIDITGNVGVGGVEMAGLPGKVVSSEDGSYRVTVEYNWSGTVTPKKEGYTFDPSDFKFQGLTYDQTQDFYAKPKQYTISGTTGMAGVLMEGFPEEVYTDADGSYSVLVDFDFSGTISPSLPGYSFKPGSMIYTKIREDKLNQDYKGSVRTYVIKGRTGMSGVKMTGLPGDPITTGPEGSYSVNVEYNWSGVVIPEKEGYSFEPADRTYSAVAEDYQSDNYMASIKEYTISGTAGEPGVILRGFPGKQVVTDESGNYTATVTHGWSGRVTPQKNGFNFDPQSIEFTKVNEDQYGKDFTASIQTYTVSGIMTSTDKNKPVEGISISFGPLGSVTTDKDGKYSFEVPFEWKGGVMPDTSLEGYSFQPNSYIYQDKPVRRDLPNQNFKATIETFKIMDVLELKGRALQGVKVTANPGNIITQSDSKGEFTIEVPYGWTGEYTLSKPGIRFDPDSKSFENVTTDYKYGEPVLPDQPTEKTTNVNNNNNNANNDNSSNGMEPINTGDNNANNNNAGNDNTGNNNVSNSNTDNNSNTSTDEESETIKELKRRLAELENAKNNPTTQIVAPGKEGEILVNEQFLGDDLLAALDILSKDTGIPIFYTTSVVGSANIKFENVPLDKALEMLLVSTPYYATKVDGNPAYYLIGDGTPTTDKYEIFSKTKVVQLDYISARDARLLLSPAFREYVMAVDDPNQRSITITAPQGKLDRIVHDLKKLDIKPSQVLLEARFVVMEKGDLLNLGVEWGWPTVNSGIMNNDFRGAGNSVLDLAGKTAWGIQMGYTPDATFTSALTQVLNLMEVNDQAKIVARPTILATDNKQARIRVLTEDYYILYAQGLQETIYSRQEMETIITGTVLAITPHISDNRDIVLDLAVEVSDSIPKSKESDLPKVTRRTAESTLRVYDGGSVAIAGLSEDRTMNTKKEVPGLSKLPLIGDLFKNNYNNKTSKEVAIFVTASIIHEPNEPQVGFVNNPGTVIPAHMQVSDEVSQLESQMQTNRDISNLSSTQSAAQTRRVPPASAYNNNPYQATRAPAAMNNNYQAPQQQQQNDPFFDFQNSGNQNNGTGRRAATRPISPEDAFNMQLNNALSGQSSGYNGSQY